MKAADNLIRAVSSVTNPWAKSVKQQERWVRRVQACPDALGGRHDKSTRFTIIRAAFLVMEDAYAKASSNGKYPAMARQIYYAARGEILELTGKAELDSNYFTQTLLPEYMERYPERTANWKVAYDARGHLAEPHTQKTVPLGTLQVHDYMAKVDDCVVGEPSFEFTDTYYPTCGSLNRFSAILFIEKEGFMQLFEQVKLAERFDLAMMSTKGQSVTASRELVDRICGECDVKLLVLHDFDASGFSIVGSFLRDSRRYQYANLLDVIDLGLRLADVEQYGLESETVSSLKITGANLADNGATPEEIAFLRGDGQSGRRVELNAFTSGQFVEFIEAKLQENGVGKVIPDPVTLAEAYRRNAQIADVNRRLPNIVEKARKHASQIDVPDALPAMVQEVLDANPELPWDQAVADLVAQEL